MAAQPGWYPAGAPGRERWWDGTQWTAYEREATPLERFAAPAPAPAQTVPAPAQAQPQQSPYPGTPAARNPIPPQYPQAQRGAPMGWYVSPKDGRTRWWNSEHWTAYYLRNGRPAAEAYAADPPYVGWVLGAMFLFIGMVNLVLGSGTRVPAIVFSVFGVLWMIGAARDTARQRVPAPQTSPSIDGSLRPFPGESEAAGAGWYAVTGNTRRWWTGARWADYILQRGTVRPTHFGRRSYRALMIIGWIVAGIGLLGVLLGILQLATGSDTDAGVGLIVVGVVIVLLGGVPMLIGWLRRFALILPTAAPPIR